MTTSATRPSTTRLAPAPGTAQAVMTDLREFLAFKIGNEGYGVDILRVQESMKLHIGVDSQSGLAHSAVVTAANVHDKHPLPDLLHGNEQRVYGDSAYASQKALIWGKAPQAKDFTNQRTRRCGVVDETQRSKNRNKSRIRARVEHVFGVVKRLWGFGKVRYRGLQKNATRAFTALALANIYLARGRLLGQVRP